MSVFHDKKFEELDWISQAIEPIESDLNNHLSNLPDVFEIDFKKYVDIIGDNWDHELTNTKILSHLLPGHIRSSLSYQERGMIDNCFQLELIGEPVMDFNAQSITNGSISLKKIMFSLDEHALKSILGKNGISNLSYATFYGDKASSRANEVMEILGDCASGLRSTSIRKKRQAITNRVIQIMKTNEWNIKDTTLANKVGYWIADYIKDGKLAAFTNFCKLKAMTHRGQPIYSMEEVE